MRDFAVRELALPDNASYRRYADLGAAAAVWNVVAAPELSLKLQTWCFPVVGCVGYRGYFDRADADAFAARIARAGARSVDVYGVPAYSTLGRLPGDFFADPLLNTFIDYPEGELARLIFHELAHQVVYRERRHRRSTSRSRPRSSASAASAGLPSAPAGRRGDEYQPSTRAGATSAR